MLKLLLAVGLVVASGDAHAQRLLVQSYTGAKPGDADTLMAPIVSVLEKRGHLNPARAPATVTAKLPRPNVLASAKTLQQLRAQLSLGFRQWDDVEFAAAIQSLTRAINIAHHNPLTIVRTSELRTRIFHAHVILALAYKRRQDIGNARRIMGDLVASFPDKKIPFSQFGREPARLRKAVAASLRNQAPGRLVIKVLGTGGTPRVFVNERFVGEGATVSVEVVTGRYRVFAVTKAGASRVRTVNVDPGAKATVTIDSAFDSALQAGAAIVLRLPQGRHRRTLETKYSVRFAKLFGATDGAIVLGFATLDKHRVIVGRAISGSGVTIREGAIRISDDVAVRKLYALAAFLDGDKPSPDVIVAGAAPTRYVARRAEAPGPRFGAWKWVSFGVAVAAMGSGAWLLHIDKTPTCNAPPGTECERLWDTRRPGIALLSVAAVAVVAGGAAWVYDRRITRKASKVSMFPTKGGLMLVFGRDF